jgi:hypothetical protein
MPYTYRSLAFAWLIIFALFAASASGLAQNGWFVLLLAIAIAIPALVLRDPAYASATSRSQPWNGAWPAQEHTHVVEIASDRAPDK